MKISAKPHFNNSSKIAHEYENRIKELAILNEIGHALSSSIVTKDLIKLIYKQTTRIIPVSGFYIALYDKQKDELFFIFDMLENKRQREEEVRRKFGKGRTEYIIRTRKPLFIDNDPNEAYRKLGIISNDHKVKACVGVPLIVSGKAIGALVVQSYNENHGYKQRHVDLLTTIANQAAIALQNARMFEEQKKQTLALEKARKEAQERVSELAILNEIGHALNASVIIKDLIKLIYEQTIRLLKTSAFYIALCDKEKKELHFIFDVLENKRQPEEEVKRKFGNGRTEYIINTRKPLFINHDPQKTYKKLGIVSNDQNAKACIGVPLIAGSEVLGALVVQSYQENHGYEQRHIGLLSTIASQAAIALQNAKLFEQQQKQNTALEKAQRDTDIILDYVNEGVFLIDQKFKIAAQYSSALEKIFETKEVARKNLVSLLQNLVSDETVSSLAAYLDLLFDPSVDEVMISELNPLEEVKCIFNTKNKHIQKYLGFIFKRVHQENRIINIFVTVQDLTAKIELESALIESKAESKKQMEWLFSILNINSELLMEYLSGAKEELDTIQQTLLKELFNTNDLNTVYRSVHTIKGNAGMLQLDFIQREAHAYEDYLSGLYNENITRYHVNELYIKYNKLVNIFTQLEILINRVNNFTRNLDSKLKNSDTTISNVLQPLLDDLSEKYNKKVKLDTKSYNPEKTPVKYKLLIRDILVQLARNSLYHGIETTEEREPQKSPCATISLSSKQTVNKFILNYEDDGRGIQINKLKEKAIESGNWQNNEIEHWDSKQLAELIYHPGLSTADHADFTAGRGIGMDLIKQKIERYGGSINVTFEPGRFTRFSIMLPN